MAELADDARRGRELFAEELMRRGEAALAGAVMAGTDHSPIVAAALWAIDRALTEGR